MSLPWSVLPGFEALSDAGQERLQAGMFWRESRSGARLLERGDQISGAYVVAEGRVRVFSVLADGSEATLYTLGPGEACVLTLNCLFADTPYPAWAEAESEARVALIPASLYRTLFRSEPIVQDITLRGLSVAVTRLIEELEGVHGMRFDRRVLRFLSQRASTEGQIAMTHEQLAKHLGSSREMVTRALGQLAADGFVEMSRGMVRLIKR